MFGCNLIEPEELTIWENSKLISGSFFLTSKTGSGV